MLFKGFTELDSRLLNPTQVNRRHCGETVAAIGKDAHRLDPPSD
jgi:hypothetical protein